MNAKIKRRRQTAAARKGVIQDSAEVFWELPEGHRGDAFSKMLVRPENMGSRLLDFRISSYQPSAHVATHAHQVQEQVYYVLEGQAVMELDGKRRVVRPGTTVFIPPGVEHAIYNTGTVDLVFFVVTSPPDDR